MKTYFSVMSIKPNPCKGCESGWGNYSVGEDEKGKFIETSSCYETCQKLKQYYEKQGDST